MSDIDKIATLLQKQHEEVKTMLLAHKREVLKLVVERKEVKDCTTCDITDADICRSCMAKAVRAEEFPLWKSEK